MGACMERYKLFAGTVFFARGVLRPHLWDSDTLSSRIC